MSGCHVRSRPGSTLLRGLAPGSRATSYARASRELPLDDRRRSAGAASIRWAASPVSRFLARDPFSQSASRLVGSFSCDTTPCAPWRPPPRVPGRGRDRSPPRPPGQARCASQPARPRRGLDRPFVPHGCHSDCTWTQSPDDCLANPAAAHSRIRRGSGTPRRSPPASRAGAIRRATGWPPTRRLASWARLPTSPRRPRLPRDFRSSATSP